ncbi:MAG: response regulator, partial [Bradymonadaceae bacterium]
MTMENLSARILLVDDEAAHLKTLERLFTREGYEVMTAEGGPQALELIRKEAFHLVITDLMMPDIDGMDVLKLVKTLQPEAEIVLMTAFGTVERAVHGMKEGAYDFITKPIKRATILKAV